MAEPEEEIKKLTNHISLLREEYVKLQAKYDDLRKKYQLSIVSLPGHPDEDEFVSNILQYISGLYDSPLQSDIVLDFDGNKIYAHKFVLKARSNAWHLDGLDDVSELVFDDIPAAVGCSLVKWCYTGNVSEDETTDQFLALISLAAEYKLVPLVQKCEQNLMRYVDVGNCVRFYQVAYNVEASILLNHCSELISQHWEDFTKDDFALMPAPLMYDMIKAKCNYPLHRAIKISREDVILLFLVNFDAQLSDKLNERDEAGMLPLEAALSLKQGDIAEMLVKNGANINVINHRGESLLHQAISNADFYSAIFLIKNGINIEQNTYEERKTAFHVLPHTEMVENEVIEIAHCLIQQHADVDKQDAYGMTVLHHCIETKSRALFEVILELPAINLDLLSNDGRSALSTCLMNYDQDLNESSMAYQLIKKGCQLNTIDSITGETLLHKLAREEKESSGIFLVRYGADCNIKSKKGETVLHLAAEYNLKELIMELLMAGADPNVQTLNVDHSAHVTNQCELAAADDAKRRTREEMINSSNPFMDPVVESWPISGDNAEPLRDDKELAEKGRQDVVPCLLTPLHVAIMHRHESAVEALVNFKKLKMNSSEARVFIAPDFTLKDSNEQTALAAALWSGLHHIALLLIKEGASIDDVTTDGFNLIHQAILRCDTASCIFLLENQIAVNSRTKNNKSSMELAIDNHLAVVVSALCKHGAEVNEINSDGDPLIWQTLVVEDFRIADILVDNKCDVNCWHSSESGMPHTLLHRAISEGKEHVACYLIEKGCDIESCSRPGNSYVMPATISAGETPLILASARGQEEVVQKLMEHGVNVNTQNTPGLSALHISISNQQSTVTHLLLSHPELNVMLRDKNGYTPFVTAMMCKDTRAARAILNRAPSAADQFDNKGRNFLHAAIEKSDVESVLFLMSIHADVNSRMRDENQLSPLHLAVTTGSEIIVRNLLLAGANVNDLTLHKQSCLHLAAESDHCVIASVLVDNGIDYSSVDDQRNNALHVAVMNDRLHTCKVLLSETDIDAEALNLKGQNPLHLLGKYGKENSSGIFELFFESMPNYPINKPDVHGNTVLLLAYMNGNASLCRVLVKAGVCLGQTNKEAVNIFNAPVASKNLLLKLLDLVPTEPPWSESEICLECGAKFGLKTRKHHCRHCGRILCGKCSSKEIPIIKFSLNKPTRVCDTCFGVLTLGS